LFHQFPRNLIRAMYVCIYVCMYVRPSTGDGSCQPQCHVHAQICTTSSWSCYMVSAMETNLIAMWNLETCSRHPKRAGVDVRVS
jgi:hypothetical protein